MTAISPRRSPKYTMNTLDVEFNLIKPIYINTIYPIVRLILDYLILLMVMSYQV